MRGIYKELWMCKFIVKFYFRWVHHLELGDSIYLIDYISDCFFIVSYNELNDNMAMVEWFIYHLQNSTNLHEFKTSPQFI